VSTPRRLSGLLAGATMTGSTSRRAVHVAYPPPAVAISIHATLACTLAIIGDFDTLTALASSAILSIYLVACAATLVLQRRRTGDERVQLRIPGGPLIPVLAIAVVVGLMATLTRREVLALAIAVAVAAVSYRLTRNVPNRSADQSNPNPSEP